MDSREKYSKIRIEHWTKVARLSDRQSTWGNSYHKRLVKFLRFIIPEGQKVIEIGCGKGSLLAALKPSPGVGIDFCPAMISAAQKKYSGLKFIRADAHDIQLDEKFDYIILSDLVNDLWDVQKVLEQMARLSHPNTRLIISFYSRLWSPILSFASFLKLSKPALQQNWLTSADVENILELAGFETFHSWKEILFPFPIPILEPFCNKYLAKIWPFYHLTLTNILMARPISRAQIKPGKPLVSVIVPARNEAGNIKPIFKRIPEMGKGTEIVFVEGHSKDRTYETILKNQRLFPERRSHLFRQTGKGKGDAVRLGFEKAKGDILMILDADLTVPPEDLNLFYRALVENKAEFINGVRLVYPMEKDAMRFFNFLGNKFFSLAFSWLLGQPIKDTLCGTKVLWKSDYERIAANRKYFGDFDPFGDFDLLFGAAKLGLRIIDLPIRYRERVYGSTNIERWKHGWLLLRMVAFAAARIKFV